MNITVFDAISGKIIKTLSLSDPMDVPLQVGPGEDWVEGTGNKKLHKVVNRVIVDLSEAEKDALREPITPNHITKERYKKLIQGKVFDVVGYGSVALQGRIEDQITLSGIKDAAVFQLQSGDTTSTRKFRDRDNIDHYLAPQHIIDLWKMGLEWMDQVYQSSWDLKEMEPIPRDYESAYYWPNL